MAAPPHRSGLSRIKDVSPLRARIPSGIPGGIYHSGRADHTNRIAIILAVVILVVLGVDMRLRNDSAGLIFLGRKLIVFIEWIAFWR